MFGYCRYPHRHFGKGDCTLELENMEKVKRMTMTDALWSPAGKGLTTWLSFVMSYCEFVTFPLVSWVRCGT